MTTFNGSNRPLDEVDANEDSAYIFNWDRLPINEISQHDVHIGLSETSGASFFVSTVNLFAR